MRKRPFPIITLAYGSMMVALYTQLGAIALLLGGSFFTALGSMQGAAALLLGAVFLGTTVAAYAVTYGLWMQRHWSWAGGVTVFGMLILGSILLSALANTGLAAVLPVSGGIAGIWLMTRPSVKLALLGNGHGADAQESTAPESMGVVPAAN
jgi:hypothetical protein